MIYELLEQITEAAAKRLSPTPLRVLVNPGEVVWDNCCDGQVWSRLTNLQPSGRPFPQFDQTQQGCSVVLWAATVSIGVLRCAAVLNDDGSPPSAKQVSSDSLTQIKDLRALEKVVTCDIPQMEGFQSSKVVGWLPLGPDGGCVGGEWTIVLAIGVCGCGDHNE